MKYLIFILFFSCNQVQPELKGTYSNNDIELTFKKGNIIGKTKCNKLNGTYVYDNENISINIKSTLTVWSYKLN